MEQSNKVERSEMWNSIYNVVKKMPLKDVDGDCIDAPSAATEIEQIIEKLHGVLERLPIGTEVTIINDKEAFGLMAGTKVKITGYCDFDKKPIGYECDGEGIFLIKDFV